MRNPTICFKLVFLTAICTQEYSYTQHPDTLFRLVFSVDRENCTHNVCAMTQRAWLHLHTYCLLQSEEENLLFQKNFYPYFSSACIFCGVCGFFFPPSMCQDNEKRNSHILKMFKKLVSYKISCVYTQ